MVEPAARIRAYKPSDEDDKLVRFVLGKAYMGLLGEANSSAYTHPFTVAAWVALSCFFIQVMEWWPDYERWGWLSFVKLLPAFACVAVPIMFLIDWNNRPAFEKLTQETMRKPDIYDLAAYYARSPSSGLWLLELGNTFVGLIAVDASLDSTTDLDLAKDAKPDYEKKGTSTVAIIRHFHVEEQFRKIDIQDDLLEHALRKTFEGDEKVEKVRIVYCALAKYVDRALNKQGFRKVKESSVSGMTTVRFLESELERSTWQKRA
ncbi:hypothetical protein OE88DRAFT_1650879 [Heliocybe sulcata]|uniref:N-acetyltransferase domain-containing protein n=1 Tax=Heliocybe sulcata TaxID=5364 RepID=A0A5C3NJ33_9AGAM|nr:hypothetical protein OE88DRAFT_1650879 [Heliocybe sulcata]